VKNSVAGFIMGPLHQSSNISALKKMPNSTKVTPKKGHHNLVSKVTFAFLFFFTKGLETDPPPIPIAIPNDEIMLLVRPQLQPR
jgi:hypothetical protein